MIRYRFFLVAALAVSGAAAAVERDTAQLELTQALTAVQAAERDDAATYAPNDLGEAHAMLDSAQSAADACATISARGVDASRIATRRVGYATPGVLAANDRRVEIVIRSDIR